MKSGVATTSFIGSRSIFFAKSDTALESEVKMSQSERASHGEPIAGLKDAQMDAYLYYLNHVFVPS